MARRQRPVAASRRERRDDKVDLRLYAMVDPEHAGGRELSPSLPRLVAQGGATLVQLRDKLGDTAPWWRGRARSRRRLRRSACRC